MSDKAEIESFIIDLKVTPAGDVKILELGTLQQSGLSGYERMTGKNLARETIYPFIESLGPQLHQYSELGHQLKEDDTGTVIGIIPIDKTAPPHNPADISAYDAILLSMGFANGAQRKFLDEDCRGRVLFSNQSRLAFAAYCHKGVFYALAEDTLGTLLPKQHLYPLKGQKLPVGAILNDFEGHSHVVLKQPQNAQAEGVEIKSTKELERRGSNTDKSKFSRLKTKFKKTWDSVIIAQEVIRGRRLPITGEDGTTQEYDPVIRVIATAYRHNGAMNIEFHDAYYKIPTKAATDEIASDALISDVKQGPTSPVIEDDLKADIFGQLSNGMKAYFDKVLGTDPAALMREWLNSDDPVYRHLAADVALENAYFDFYKSGHETYPVDIAQTLFERHKEEKGVKLLMRRGNRYENYGDKDLKDFILTRAEKGRLLWRFKAMDWYADNAIKLVGAYLAIVGSLFTYDYLAPDSVGEMTEDLESTYSLFDTTQAFTQAAAPLENTAFYGTTTSAKKADKLAPIISDLTQEYDLTSCFAYDAAPDAVAAHITRIYGLESPSDRFIGISINGTFNVLGQNCPDVTLPSSVTSALMQNAEAQNPDQHQITIR